MPTTLTIGKLGQASGVNIETIRYYERNGLLPAPARSSSGYRHYREDDIKRDRKSTRLNSSHNSESRMPSSA
jgi:DNA-binding transcriptional MerR regulator